MDVAETDKQIEITVELLPRGARCSEPNGWVSEPASMRLRPTGISDLRFMDISIIRVQLAFISARPQ
jgi:hypothetical protein